MMVSGNLVLDYHPFSFMLRFACLCARLRKLKRLIRLQFDMLS